MFNHHRIAKTMLVGIVISYYALSCPGEVLAAQNFYISRPKLGFELSFEFEKETDEGPFTDRDDETTTYNERLDIETDGWIYHPALAIFDVTLSPEWEQEIEEDKATRESESSKAKTRSFLEGYEGEVTFFQYKPVSLSLFGKKSRSTITSNFVERTERETDLYGGHLSLGIKDLPSDLHYIHTETDQSGLFEQSTRSDEVRLQSNYDKKYGNTAVNLSYADLQDKTIGSEINTITKMASIHNFYRFTGKRTASINSSYLWKDFQNKSFAEKGYSLNEILNIQHRKNLSTSYNGRYENYDQNTQQNDHARRETHYLGFNLNHKHYENLDSNVFLNTNKNHNDSGQVTTYTGGVSWNYTRRIPIGIINTTTTQRYTVVDDNPDLDERGFVQVLGEPITITDIRPDFLENKHVNLVTIEVFNTARTRQYRERFDYRVEEIGDFVRISCVLGGQIDIDTPGGCAAGASLLVDYEFLSNPPFDYSITDRSYGLSLDLWDDMKLYYRFVRSRQRFLQGTKPDTLSASEQHKAGFEYRWKWSRTILDYTDITSTETPLESWLLTEELIFRPSRRSYIFLSASAGRIRFKDVEEETGTDTDKFYTYRALYQLIPFERSRFDVEGFYTRAWGITHTREDKGISSTFNYTINIYSVDISYTFTDERDKTAEETNKNHRFMVTIKRELF
jgi:hypothetical protein